MNLLKVNKLAQRQYKEDVKNNADEEYMTIRKKLTRNFILGEVYNENEDFIWVRYGNMFISVNKKDEKIVNVANDRIHKYEFNINMEYKKILDYQLGLK